MYFTYESKSGLSLDTLVPGDYSATGLSGDSKIFFTLTSDDEDRVIYASSAIGYGAEAVVCVALLMQLSDSSDSSATLFFKIALKLFKVDAPMKKDQGVAQQLEAYHMSETLGYKPAFIARLQDSMSVTSLEPVPDLVCKPDELRVTFQTFTAVEYLGRDLQVFMNDAGAGKLIFTDLLDIFISIIVMAGEILQRGYIYVDIKPENILIDGERNVRFCDASCLSPFGVLPKTGDHFMLTPWFVSRLFMLQYPHGFPRENLWRFVPSELVSVSCYALMFMDLLFTYPKSPWNCYSKGVLKTAKFPGWTGKARRLHVNLERSTHLSQFPLVNVLLRALGYAMYCDDNIMTFEKLQLELQRVKSYRYSNAWVHLSESKAEQAGNFDRNKYFDEDGYPKFGRGQKDDPSTAVIPRFPTEASSSTSGAGSGSGGGGSTGKSSRSAAGAGAGGPPPASYGGVSVGGGAGGPQFFARQGGGDTDTLLVLSDKSQRQSDSGDEEAATRCCCVAF